MEDETTPVPEHVQQQVDADRSQTAPPRGRLTHLLSRAAAVVRSVPACCRGRARACVDRIRSHARTVVGALIVLALTVGGTAYFVHRFTVVTEPVAYEDAWMFVPATVSKSAGIRVSLPDGVTVRDMPSAVTFTPQIKGSFKVADDLRSATYFPEAQLPLDTYYSVALKENDVQLSGDFKVVEDPKVVSIFPATSTEAHEDSRISLVFNRPMVPLSTLTERDVRAVPVTIEPAVEGGWVWKSTRMLQFVPAARLQQSTAYTVQLASGLRSLDGVAVPPVIHTFTTRTLKRTGASEGTVLFNEPYRITFNIPVDLARTKEAIQVTHGDASGVAVPFSVRYGKRDEHRERRFLGLSLFSTESKVDDPTILEIVPDEDSHGRNGVWDISSSYHVRMRAAYPVEGTKSLDQAFNTSFVTPGVFKEVRAESPRSEQVSTDLFDPQGALTISFYEPIDRSGLAVSMKGLDRVEYGTKCKEDADGNPISKAGSSECDREPDETVIRLTVKANSLAPGEDTELRLNKVVAQDGTVLTSESIPIPVHVYPAPQLLNSSPRVGGTDASLTELELCTNVPLKEPDAGAYRDALKTSGYLVFPANPWSSSYFIREGDWILSSHMTVCSAGQFRTVMHYGLHPSAPYTFALSLTDDFGQTLTAPLSFTTTANDASDGQVSALQPMYNVSVPGNTKLTFASENLESITVNVCKVSAAMFLGVLEGQPSEFVRSAEPEVPCTDEKTVSIDVPDVYHVYQYFQIDPTSYFTDPRGQYIITLYHPRFATVPTKHKYLRTYLSVTSLAVGQKTVGWYNQYDERDRTARSVSPDAQDLYWVVQAQTLDPVVRALVTPYESAALWGPAEHLSPRAAAYTGADGVARSRSTSGVRGAVVVANGEAAVVSAWADELASSWSNGGESRTYLYSDRPIYRPGDVVHLKGIDRVGFDGAWRTVTDIPAHITVRNSRGDDVWQHTVPVTSFGTFTADFTLPQDAPLGTYYVEAFGGYGSFDVEEYVPAAFKLAVASQKDAYIAGDTLSVSVDAQYYFGMPVTDATVEYDIVAQDYYFAPDSVDGWWSFGRSWYTCPECGYGDHFIRRGTLKLDGNGKGTISLPLAFADLFKNPENVGSKIFSVRVRVKDMSGRQVAGNTSVIVHRGTYYLGVRSDPMFVGKGNAVALAVKSVDADGKPIKVSDITRTITSIEWRSFKRREVDGAYYWHSEEVKRAVDTRELSTDADGNASDQYTFTKEGEYEITVAGTDARHNPVIATVRVYVYGDGQVSVRETSNASLDVRLDKENYEPGEVGHALFTSPFMRAKALVTIERGGIRSYHVNDIRGSVATVPFTVPADLIPNGYLSVLLLSPSPEVRQGSTMFTVSAESRELTVEVTPNKKQFLPGEPVELSVYTKDASGKGVSADVSVGVVDLSVLALAGNQHKDPAAFFYGPMPLGVSTRHNLKNILMERDIPTGTKGGGGDSAEDLATKKRGEFRDTAYWDAQVVTDANGTARVRFTLPDNVTTWQIESLGVTNDLHLGTSYEEIVTKKQLMIVPKKPRFVLPGDTMRLGVQVLNNTDTTHTIDVSVESSTLILRDAQTSVRLKAGESKLVYFDAEAPTTVQKGAHLVTWRARYEGASDVVELSLPIRRNTTYETVATAGMGTDPLFTEYLFLPRYIDPSVGEVTVHARATLAGMLSESIGYLATYPYGCAEQISSTVAGLALATKIENTLGSSSLAALPVIADANGNTLTVAQALRAGLQKLYTLQNYDGGFAWYAGMDSDVYLTLEVLRALSTVEAVGVHVQAEVIARAAQYAQDALRSRPNALEDNELMAGFALALSAPTVPAQYRSVPVPYVTRIARDTRAIEELSSSALGYLALASVRGAYSKEVADTFFRTLENRTAIDARGAYVRTGRSTGDQWYETPDKDTGLFLAAIAARGGTHTLASQVLSWLRARRSADGSWGTTNATLSVVEGVLAYTVARHEQVADMDVVLSLNGTEGGKQHFGTGTLFDTFTHAFPLTSVPLGSLTRLAISKTDTAAPGTLYYDMVLRYALPPQYVVPCDEGITVERSVVALNDPTMTQLTRAKVGDVVKGVLTITVPEEYAAVSIEDYIPAGFELVNMRLATEGVSVETERDMYGTERVKEDDGWFQDPESPTHVFPATFTEFRDDRAFAFTDRLAPGVYTFTYHLRALVPGTFTHLPATVSEMYFPEVFGRTAAGTFTIEE